MTSCSPHIFSAVKRGDFFDEANSVFYDKMPISFLIMLCFRGRLGQKIDHFRFKNILKSILLIE